MQFGNLKIGAAEFFNILYYGSEEGYITVWHKRTKRTKWFHIKDKDEAAKYALSKAMDEKYPDEIYYGVCLRKEQREESLRGELADISVMPGVWWDIDVAEEDNVHAQKDLPKNFDEAIDFIKIISPPPSVIVHSGHGLHAYWLFEKPLVIADDNNRKRCQSLSNDWQAYLNNECAKRGWKGDNTSDLPRILRIPQTFNRKKGGCIEVKVIESTGIKYLANDFIKQSKQASNNTPIVKAILSTDTDAMDFNGIITGGAERIDNCKFIQYCRNNAAALSEPEWYACISNLALCKDGAKHCHNISKPHSNYKFKETENKIIHAQKVKKPVTCAYIKSTLGFNCGDCALCVKAPVALTVMSKVEQVKETLSLFPKDIAAVFAPEYLEALSFAKKNLVAEYAVLKINLKKLLGVNLNDLEQAVKSVKHESQQTATLHTEGRQLKLENLEQQFIVPQGYEVTSERGVEKQTSNGIVPVCFQPIVITERFHNLDKSSERIRLKFLCRGKWDTITENKSVLSNRNSIVRLADYGLAVTSNNAGAVIQYLTDFESANNNTILTRDVVSKIGWRDLDFLPFTSDSISFEADDAAGIDLATGLTTHGRFEQWLSAAEIVRKASPTSRFLFTASFAAPLMKLIDARTFMVFVWCESGYGKSASIKAGLSAWGNPNKLQGTFNTTQAGLERKCAALNNLPYVIEERQLLNEKRLDPEMVMYMFADERSKQKAERSGNLAETLTWKNIVISGGEQPVTSTKFQDGAQNRILELSGKPLSGYIEAGKVHEVTNANYGHSGRLFIECLVEKLKGGYDINAEFKRMADAVQKEYGSTAVHLKNVTAVALGDYLASTIVFEDSIDTAWQAAVSTAVAVLKDNESGRLDAAAERGYEFIKDWLMKNMAKFDGTSYGDKYGIYEKGKLDKDGKETAGTFYVYPTFLDNALKEQGFSPEQVFRDMVAKRRILTESHSAELKSGSKVYTGYKIHRRINGENPRVYGIPMAEREVKAVQLAIDDGAG